MKMGGTITVLLKAPDGKEYHMLRWTNATSYYFTNMRFVNNDQSFIDEYIDMWVNGDHEFGVVPSGYSIIAADMPRKKLLWYSNYNAVGNILTMDAFPTRDTSKDGPISFVVINDEWKMDHDRIDAFARDGRITGFRPFTRLNTIPFESLKNAGEIMNAIRNRKLAGTLHVDMKPYEIQKYKFGKDDILDVMNRVEQMGFTFSEKEHMEWNSFKKGDER